MSVGEKKKFVMKHTFIDVKNMENSKRHYVKNEKHFNIPWSIFIYSYNFPMHVQIYFECLKPGGDGNEWSIDTTIETRILTKEGEKIIKDDRMFKHDGRTAQALELLLPLGQYLVDSNLTVECHVTIHNMTGIQQLFVNYFDTDSAKEFSDIVLKVNDQKFYVYKMYLSFHSTYFKSLFLGNFDESKQSEVELKNIDPEKFQNFLKVVYGMPDINDETVDGILQLADMYDAKPAMQQCEKFLIKESSQNFKTKFLLAIQYKLEDLKKKCMPEFKTSEDIASVIPKDSAQFGTEVWKELLNLSLDFNKKLAGK